MRTLGLTLSLVLALSALGQLHATAGERLPNIASLPVGFKFCPAPGADNSEFNSSYYAVDAQTGQMSRYVDGQPNHELEPVDTEEKILFVAPTIDVQNKYVPYPGAAPQQPPAMFANSDHGDNQQRAMQQQRYAQQQQQQMQQQRYAQQQQQQRVAQRRQSRRQPVFTQPQQQYQQQYQQQEYAHHPNAMQNNQMAQNRVLR